MPPQRIGSSSEGRSEPGTRGQCSGGSNDARIDAGRGSHRAVTRPVAHVTLRRVSDADIVAAAPQDEHGQVAQVLHRRTPDTREGFAAPGAHCRNAGQGGEAAEGGAQPLRRPLVEAAAGARDRSS